MVHTGGGRGLASLALGITRARLSRPVISHELRLQPGYYGRNGNQGQEVLGQGYLVDIHGLPHSMT